MRGHRPSIRSRLTLLYSGLVAAAGIILIGIMYALVAGTPPIDPTASASASPGAGNALAKCLSLSDSSQSAAQCEQYVHELASQGATGQQQAVLGNLLLYSAVGLFAVIVIAGVAGWVVSSSVISPVRKIAAAARAASESNLATRVSLAGPNDELHDLADTFDAMLDRLDRSFTEQKRFIANASHELRTPLSAMRTTIDVVLAKPRPSVAELVEMGTDTRISIDQATGLVEALLALARSEHGPGAWEPIDVSTIVEDVLDSTDARELELVANLESSPVTGDPLLIERMIGNLIDNAVRYNLPDGRVAITTAPTPEGACLVVSNSGPVVPPGRVQRLFLPFERLAERTTGSTGFGLGLSIVSSIVTVHRGTVVAESQPGGGLTVTVTLPHDPTRAIVRN